MKDIEGIARVTNFEADKALPLIYLRLAKEGRLSISDLTDDERKLGVEKGS